MLDRPKLDELTRMVSERIAHMERANELILRPLRQQLRQLQALQQEHLRMQRDAVIAELEKLPPGQALFADSMGYD